MFVYTMQLSIKGSIHRKSKSHNAKTFVSKSQTNCGIQIYSGKYIYKMITLDCLDRLLL